MYYINLYIAPLLENRKKFCSFLKETISRSHHGAYSLNTNKQINKVILLISEPTAYNELALRQNAGILEYSRTSMSSLSGCAAGILGLTGLYGFAFYFITAFLLSVSTCHSIF